MLNLKNILAILVAGSLLLVCAAIAEERSEVVNGIEIVSYENSSIAWLTVGVAVTQHNGSVMLWYSPESEETTTTVDMGNYDWRVFDNATAVALTPKNHTAVNLSEFNATKNTFPGGLTVLTKEGLSMVLFDNGIAVMTPFDSMAKAFTVDDGDMKAEVSLTGNKTIVYENAKLVRLVNAGQLLADMGITG